MKFNETFDSVNEALPRMLNLIHNAGTVIPSRAGETKEITHVGISLHDPRRREILLPSRKPNLAAQIVETMWVLAGKNDVETLAHYLPRAADFSDDGVTWRAGYGKRLRDWDSRDPHNEEQVDQIEWVVEHLKKDPGSRRAVLSIWDPLWDTADGVKDIPCNDWLSFLIRDGHLDLHVAVRSNDVIWGWSGINQFEWSVLLEVVAGLVGVKVGSLHFSTTSFHLYDRHYAKAEKIVENAYPLPFANLATVKFKIDIESVNRLDALIEKWFVLEGCIRNGNPSEAAVDAFPEPLMQAWLRVLQWWWTGEREYLSVLDGTTLECGAQYSVQPKGKPGKIKPLTEYVPSKFIEEVCALHIEKDAAYGPSWKKRGEAFSIIPNIARKIDRIESGVGTSDETSVDTAQDLFVYLGKYRTWLDEQVEGPIFLNWGDSDGTGAVNEVLLQEDERYGETYADDRIDWPGTLVSNFNDLLVEVEKGDHGPKVATVNLMLGQAYRFARTLWERERVVSQPDTYRGADRD